MHYSDLPHWEDGAVNKVSGNAAQQGEQQPMMNRFKLGEVRKKTDKKHR